MRATDELLNLLDGLTMRWAGTGYAPMFDALTQLLEADDDAVRAAAEAAIRRATEAGDDHRAMAPVLVAALFAGLRSEERASFDALPRALGVTVDLGVDLAPVVGALARLIEQGVGVRPVCLALARAADRGCDLTPARAALGRAMDHPEMAVRHHASLALSRDMLRSGEEAPVQVRQALNPGQGWILQASRRRIFAASDARLTTDPAAWQYEARRPCLACGGTDTHCIFYDGWSDLTGTDLLFEYRCEDCGIYSLYEFAH